MSHREENPQLLEILELYGRYIFRRTSAFGLEDFIRKVNFAGDTCLEIGTHYGITAVVLSQYFKKVISLDITNEPQKHKIVDDLEIKNIEFISVRDNEQKARVIKILDFDAAYMDGDHENDTESDFELVRRCKNVLFHEYWFIQPQVYNLVNSLDNVTSDHTWFAHWRG